MKRFLKFGIALLTVGLLISGCKKDKPENEPTKEGEVVLAKETHVVTSAENSKVDNVRAYNRELTQNEITELYNAKQ